MELPRLLSCRISVCLAAMPGLSQSRRLPSDLISSAVVPLLGAQRFCSWAAFLRAEEGLNVASAVLVYLEYGMKAYHIANLVNRLYATREDVGSTRSGNNNKPEPGRQRSLPNRGPGVKEGGWPK